MANELRTDLPTFNRFHSTKLIDVAKGLRNWLRDYPSADARDRLVAQSLLDEIGSVLGGAP